MFYNGVLMETIGIHLRQSKKQVQFERKAHQISQSDK